MTPMICDLLGEAGRHVNGLPPPCPPSVRVPFAKCYICRIPSRVFVHVISFAVSIFVPYS